MKKNEAEKEQHIQKVLEDKEKERLKAALKRRLREEEKVETAKRLDRQREMRREKLRERMDESMSRVENIQSERAALYRDRQNMLAQLQKQKDRMNETMNDAILNNNRDERSLRKLASEYGLDLSKFRTKRLCADPCQQGGRSQKMKILSKREGRAQRDPCQESKNVYRIFSYLPDFSCLDALNKSLFAYFDFDGSVVGFRSLFFLGFHESHARQKLCALLAAVDN